MKTMISKLKRGDNFKFNDKTYQVYKPFRKWNRGDDPYLLATSNEIFYHDGLEVELCHNCLRCQNYAACNKTTDIIPDMCKNYVKIK